jgi:potassium intermediate/small conductance calcium-activated channel subfamily N protein 2
MMGKQSGYIFSFKCLLISKTLQTLIFITILTCLTFAYMLKIIEGPVFLISNTNNKNNNKNNDNNYMFYFNCFWNVLVTMTTVGYGDYFPKSILGRFIIFIVTLFGTIIMALNINYFQSIIHLNDNDKHTLNLIQRLEFKDNIGNLAVSYFKNNYMYVIQKRKYFRGEINNNDEQRNIMIQKARNKFFFRKKYKEVVHRFQIKYKMATDVDQVKKKIRNLDDTIINIEKKLKSFLKRYTKFVRKNQEKI